MDYIKLFREILNWEWWHDINTCRVFIFLLLKANWKDTTWKGIEVKRGSYISSLDKVAADTDLTRDEVRTAIKHLIKTKEITTVTTRKYTVFSVVNYDLYQNVPTQNPTELPNKSPTIPLLIPSREEKKEGKKERNNIPPISPTESIQQFMAAYPRSGNMHQIEITFIDCLMTKQVTEEQLIGAAKNYADRCNRLKTDKRYMKLPENFLRDMEYCQYIPGVYEPPEVKGSNGFNQFTQNNYDFDSLEKELLSN